MTTNNAVNVGLAGSTGSGSFVGSNSPAIVTPNLGTPTALVLTSATGLLPAGFKTGSAAFPYFSAYNNTNSSLAANQASKCPLEAEDFDVGGYFDSTTNYRYTPLVAGVYRFSWVFALTNTNVVATSRYISLLYKNGSQIKNGTEAGPGTSLGISSGGSALVQMNGSTDYVELWFLNGNGATTVTTGGSSFSNYLCGEWVGPLT